VIERDRPMLAAWLPWAAGQTLRSTGEFIRSARRQGDEDVALEAAIVQDGAIVGTIGLSRVIHAHGFANLGYWLASDAQGRGTVTLAAAAMIEWALRGPWQLHRIEVRAGVENVRSRAVPERLGFTFEGVSRGAERIGDRWLDHAVYGLLADEWAGYPAPGYLAPG
jgi:ribosomal-protein-serine acetyltransferase